MTGQPPVDSRRVLVAANPFSGPRRKERLVDGLLDALRAESLEPVAVWDRAERAVRLREGGWRCVVVAAGDGTVNDVVNECLDFPLAVLPLGTENLFARRFGCGLNLGRLARAVSRLQCRAIDVAELVRPSGSRRLAGLADLRERVREVAFLLNAVHGLRLARRFGCRVSVELHTDFADDVEETLRHARRFHAISPDRFIVKVPLTAAGLVAVRRLSAEGIPVNLTVGFSARQNYLAAVLSRPAFVNVFVGRIGAFLTENGFGDGIPAAVRAARSSQRAVAEARRQAGAPTRQIIASLRAVAYVTALAGADVFTINTAVARAWEAAPGAVAPVHFDALPPTGLGADAESALGAACLWDVPAAFQSATQRLAQTAPAALTPQALRGELAQAGFASLLRPWSPDERLSAREDGLLPKYSRWKDALARGEVALDSLFNLAVFMAFVKDQEGMDRRIAGLIGR